MAHKPRCSVSDEAPFAYTSQLQTGTQRPGQVNAHFLATLLLRHLPLRSFRRHFLGFAHRPVVLSWHADAGRYLPKSSDAYGSALKIIN